MDANASRKTTPETPSLHPQLQAALSALDANLEEELNRYKQYQQQRKGIILSPSEEVTSTLNATNQEFSQLTPSNEDEDWSAPQDYLASSEELLRNLNDPEEEEKVVPKGKLNSRKKTTSWFSYVLTPLGIAGILIFFLAGTLLSLIMINFGQNRLADSSPEETSSQPETLTTSDQNEEIPNRPNLAEDEFIELDVDNLVEAEPSAEIPLAARPSCGGNFYCVMVENPSQTDQEKTRQLVGDAYLRNFPEVGQVLQVGAFDTQSRAEELQQRLEEQGISTTIYGP